MTAWGHNNLTYEGTYWRWIQRAWLGGLRLMVMSVNENRVLCELAADAPDQLRRDGHRPPRLPGHPRAAALRRRAGRRPGQGLLPDRHRPVRRRGASSTRARWPWSWRSRSPSCSAAGAGTSRRATRRRSTASSTSCTGCGVRSSLLLNKFDNPLTGVRFDSGPVGALINVGEPAERRARSGARRPAPARCTTTRSRPLAPQGSAALDSILGDARRPERHAARLSARAALQHARAHRRSARTS